MAAVDKETTELKLRFFNNCFHDDFSDGEYISTCMIRVGFYNSFL